VAARMARQGADHEQVSAVALGPERQQMEGPARALTPTRKISDRGRTQRCPRGANDDAGRGGSAGGPWRRRRR
jgi:hypothetical protein